MTTIEGKTFQGTRAPDGVRNDGGEGLRAKSNTAVENCKFLDLGNGAVRISIPVDNLTIENCGAGNLYRCLEDTCSDKANPATLTNFAIKGVIAREIDRGMTRIRYGSHSGTIENVVAYASSQCDLYCVGFQLEDEAHDITYAGAEAHGFRETTRSAGQYWNGDGFSDEHGNHDIRYLSCVATECTDGGFDLKSANVYLDNCTSRSNKRNYRLWGSGKLHRCKSEDPHLYGGTGKSAHFSFHGDADGYVIDRPIVNAAAGNSAPVFLIATTSPLHLEIRNATINAPDAALFAVYGPDPVITWVPDRSSQNITVAQENA
ncbi:MAG: hypothetical protein P8Y58_18305 [Novosphingobium sp.]